MQNRMLMERLTIAESDIAQLKNDYIELKEDYSSLKTSAESCFESKSRDDGDGMDTELDDIKVSIPPNMMSIDMKNKDHGR